MAKLILIRGLPGSGKSTMAKKVERFVHLEADMFHVQGDGVYRFKAHLLGAAHKWCQETCLTFLRNGINVVVANTFTTKKELAPYLAMKDWCDCTVEIIEAKGDYGNVHGVPQDVIDKMRARWESI